MNFLQTFEPNRILFSFGILKIHWYGFFVLSGILAAIGISIFLARYYKNIHLNTEELLDIAFILIINGIIGARVYEVFLEFAYYSKYPWDIFKIWQGGLAIHGTFIACALVLWYLYRYRKINVLLLASIAAPGLALGQAIGRWGNYFNQELFGCPTDLPWGIFISVANRPSEYLSATHFHPTFLYESLANLIIFLILIFLHYLIISKNFFRKYRKSKKFLEILPLTLYLIFYSILRFSLEFIRIDKTLVIANLRFPQIASLLTIFFVIVLMGVYLKKENKCDNN